MPKFLSNTWLELAIVILVALLTAAWIVDAPRKFLRHCKPTTVNITRVEIPWGCPR